MQTSPFNNSRNILSKQEKEEIIKSYLSEIINKNKESTVGGKYFSKFKDIWNSSKKTRFAIGISLSAGVAVSTLGGSFVVAGGLLLARAALGSIGGYMATDSIFDLINSKFAKNPIEKALLKLEKSNTEEDLKKTVDEIMASMVTNNKDSIKEEFEKSKEKMNSKKRVKKILSATSAIAMGILGGSKAADAVEHALSSETIISGTSSKIAGILGNPPLAKPLDTAGVKEIFADIRHDHPDQNYVTLEQAERRIEGLRQGIPLSESEKLNPLNKSIASDIRKAGSPLRTTMENMGYLKPGQNLDEVARKLSESDISKILLEEHRGDFIGNATSISTPKEVLENHILGFSPTEPIISSAPAKTVAKGSNRVFEALLGLAAAFGIGGMTYKFLKSDTPTQSLNSENGNSLKNGKNDSISSKEIYKEQRPAKSNNDKIVDAEYVEIPGKKEPQKVLDKAAGKIQLTDKAPSEEKEIKISDGFKDKVVAFDMIAKQFFGFDFKKVIMLQGKEVAVVTKPTLGGDYILFLSKLGDGYCLDLKYIENGEIKIAKCVSMDSNLNDLKEKIKTLYKHAIREKDIMKCHEFARNLRKFEVTRSDLASIYKQLELPEIVNSGFEIGGFWYTDLYTVDNGTFRLKNLQNPKISELNLTTISNGVRAESVVKWEYDLYILQILKNFDDFESELMIELFNEHLHDGIKILPGASFAYHWHKHPWQLYKPSIDDLTHPNSAGIVDLRNRRDMQIYPWFIVNALPQHINEKNKPRNSVILRGKDFGGRRDYIMYAWKMPRNKENRYSESDLYPVDFEVCN